MLLPMHPDITTMRPDQTVPETGGNPAIASVGKLLTVMGVQADTIRTLSKISGQSYNNRQMHEMHNSLFGGPTGDYGTDISDLLTNANNFIKQQNQQIQKLYYSCMHRGPRFTYQMQSP